MENDTYTPVEESLHHLHRSGWIVAEITFTSASGRTVHLVEGANGGENRIHVKGSTQAEAWHRAVEAAAACGMLRGWPRPMGGR